MRYCRSERSSLVESNVALALLVESVVFFFFREDAIVRKIKDKKCEDVFFVIKRGKKNDFLRYLVEPTALYWKWRGDVVRVGRDAR